MTAPAATFAGARRLFVVSGLAALLAMLANVVEIVLGFGGEIRHTDRLDRASADRVVTFLANGQNLPRWAVGFAKAVRRSGTLGL